MSRSTESLVGELASELVPVHRIPPTRLVALVAAGAAAAAAALALWAWGIADDSRVLAPRYWLAAGGLVLLGGGALGAALGSSVPGSGRLVRAGAAAMLAGAGLALLGSALMLARIPAGEPAGAAWSAASLSCLASAVLVAVPAALLLTWFTARGFPHRPGWTLAAVALGVVALGALPVLASCGSPYVLHQVFAHVLAPLVAGPVLWLALRAVYVGVARPGS